MTIDYRDWVLSGDRTGVAAETNAIGREPTYRMVEQSAAWQQLTGWLREQIEAKQHELATLTQDLQFSGDYSHQGLIEKKVRVDICQSEVLLLGNIEKKVLSYTQEAD
jgi:hypothetical protein